ncbi:Phage minor tail protein L [compost metagenome]
MELIATDAQQLVQEPKISLFEIDATQYGDAVLRFTPAVDGESWPVQLGGNVYQRLSIKAEGFEWNGSGTAPRPSLSLAALDLVFLSLIISTDDLVGCPVRRIRTYRKYLDDGATPNPSATFPVDHFLVERKTSQRRKQITFELSTPMDQQGKMVPAKQVIRDTCLNRFRYWANGQWNYDGVTCPYAGALMYEPNGNVTADPTKAKCGKKLADCKTHFGADAVLPFFGFPGVGRIS